MNRIRSLVNHEWISAGLAAVALFSCLLALTAAASPTLTPIPERLLERVQGANPAYYQYPNSSYPNCSALEAAYLTVLGYGTTVPASGCNAANINTSCVQRMQ